MLKHTPYMLHDSSPGDRQSCIDPHQVFCAGGGA